MSEEVKTAPTPSSVPKEEGKEEITKRFYDVDQSSPASKEDGKEEKAALRKELRALAKSGDEASFSELANYAADTDPKNRKAAAEALGRSKNKEAFDLLLVLIHDESSPVRGAAAQAMGHQRNEKAADVLMEVLEKDKSVAVRGKAVQGLGRLRTEKAMDKVIDCLKSEEAEIRRSAAGALGGAKDRKVIEPLIAALNDPDQKARNAASKSLSKLSGQDELSESVKGKSADEMHKAWQDWWEKNKETFEFAGRDRRGGPSASAGEWMKKYDADKNGKLDEKELQTALDEKKGKAKEEIKKGTPLKADVTVKKPDGSEATLRDLLKGPTLIYYFQSKCPHCVKAEGFIKKLYADNKGKGIAFLGIASSRENTESLNAYLDKARFDFPVVLDAGKGFAKQNGVRGTPAVLIVDASGKIQESYRGLSDGKKEQLAKCLAGN